MKTILAMQYLNLQDKGYHICVNCIINGYKDLTVLIDTGASNSVFDINHKAFLSIEKESLPADNISSGFSASIDNISVGIIDLIEFDDYKTSIEPALFTSLEHVNSVYAELKIEPLAGIIGCDFLKKNKAIINLKKGQLQLG